MSNAETKVAEAVEIAAEEIAADKIEMAEAVAEAAQARVENAEAVAQSIMDATVMTELGRRVDSLQTEVVSCRAENETLKLKLSLLETTLADLSAKLPPTMIAPPVELPPTASRSPIPPASEKTEVVLAENPLDAEGDGQKAPDQSKKRRRFAL